GGGDGSVRRMVAQRLESRRLVHPGEKSRGCNACSFAKFEKPSPWLRRNERSQQRSGLRLRGHREAEVEGLAKDRLKRDRRIDDGTMVQMIKPGYDCHRLQVAAGFCAVCLVFLLIVYFVVVERIFCGRWWDSS